MEITLDTAALYQWFGENAIQLTITLAVITVYAVLDRISTPRLEQSVDQGRFKEGASTKAIRVARAITGLVGLLILVAVWGIQFHSVIIFATTTVTLLGVAFFASWSLLSNVTAYFVILAHPSFRRGNFVRVFENDNYAEGYISELTLFNTRLVTENREVIIYPNSLLLGRPALVNPRGRLRGVGKLPPYSGDSVD
jgi:small-conductance mechanosensitive channel